MPVIVTGAGGFVGRALITKLLAADKKVVGVDIRPKGIPEGVRVVAGDIASPQLRADAFAEGCSALIHLATVPGAAAEADPAESRRINIDAMYDLLDAAKASGARPRVVYASSIAVFGDPLPFGGVDDTTPLAPRLVYGGHKAMMETAMAMMHHRGEIEGVSVRLPGILARPKGPSGMKSAFMSDLFHALRAGEAFVCPVSREATIWAQSVEVCVSNLVRALMMTSDCMPRTRVVTLPALRVTMGDLVAEIARQCSVSDSLVSYASDAALEAAFGAHPELRTPAAEACGFAHDGSTAKLVKRALVPLRATDGA